MNRKTVCVALAVVLAAVAWQALGADPVEVNPAKVCLVVELGPSLPLPKSGDGKLIGGMYGQSAESILKNATEAIKGGMSFFEVAEAQKIKGAGEAAAKDGTAYLVHVLLKDRRVDVSTGAANPSYILKADCTIYRSPAMKGGNPEGTWDRSPTLSFECKGFQMARLGGISEYTSLANQVRGMLMRDVCPIKVKGMRTLKDKAQIAVVATNKTTKDITQVTLSVPTTNPYITETATAAETIPAGEQRTLTVEVSLPYSHDGKTTLKHNQTYVSGVTFDNRQAPAAPGGAARGGRSSR
ncbi:MAG: hypothetical protein JXL80_04575 [Planctomycetes bacterium]|nr:hypothetical protein [Planctomycetota bacterium]